jgi:hypothetical protein
MSENENPGAVHPSDADEFGTLTVTVEARDTSKATIPADAIPQSVKDIVAQANADQTKRVVVGPLKDKVTATRFAGLAQAYGINFPGGRITVRCTVRDDHSVAVSAAPYVKRTLEQETKDKMRIAKLEKSVSKAKESGDKNAIAAANKALKAAKDEIAARDAADAAA